MNTTTLPYQITLQQLGGGRFLAMTGAKNLMHGNEGRKLYFTLPSNFAKGGINRVSVEIMPNDTYTMTFGKARGVNYTEKKKLEGVYNDMLRSIFTDVTGLHTSL